MARGKMEDMLKDPLRPTEAKMRDLMAKLSERDRARIFDQKSADASPKAVQEGSSKAERKNSEAKP